MRQINLGIIGTGNIALEHLKVISKIKNLNPYGITSKTNKNSKKWVISIFSKYVVYLQHNDLVAD